jgi:hypothetical protein
MFTKPRRIIEAAEVGLQGESGRFSLSFRVKRGISGPFPYAACGAKSQRCFAPLNMTAGEWRMKVEDQ